MVDRADENSTVRLRYNHNTKLHRKASGKVHIRLQISFLSFFSPAGRPCKAKSDQIKKHAKCGGQRDVAKSCRASSLLTQKSLASSQGSDGGVRPDMLPTVGVKALVSAGRASGDTNKV